MQHVPQITGLEAKPEFDPKMDKYFGEFMTERRATRRVRPATLRGYEGAYHIFKKMMPNFKLEELSPNAISIFNERLNARKRIVGRGEARCGVRSSTIATYNHKLDSFFDWLKIRKYIPENPFDSMEHTRVTYEDKKFMSGVEIERIFTSIGFIVCKWNSTLTLKRNRLIFALLLHCGLRKSELLGLHLADVDLVNDVLTVRSTTSKSLTTRQLPINYELRIKLDDYISERKKCNCSAAALLVSDKDHSTGLTAPGLLHLLDKVRGASGVKFHLHQFRHTYAVNLLNQGTSLPALQQLLGHTDIRMTAAYTRCLPDSMMRKYVNKISLGNLI